MTIHDGQERQNADPMKSSMIRHATHAMTPVHDVS